MFGCWTGVSGFVREAQRARDILDGVGIVNTAPERLSDFLENSSQKCLNSRPTDVRGECEHVTHKWALRTTLETS